MIHKSVRPFVTIIMPALNEERYISAAIASVLPRSEELDCELLVVDGGSTDRTREIVEDLAAADNRIHLIPNEKRLQAAGVNLGARLADPRSRYIVRADCHLKYPPGFVERCVGTLAEKDAASVVVPMHTVGATCLQKAIAAAQNSRLGNGGSAHRIAGRSAYVEHGHHAVIDRAIFLELGGYDESFSHNEDAEFDQRLTKSGNRIYLNGEAAVTYFPRETLGALSRQYFSHGWGRARTFLKHHALPRLRQLLPVAAFIACVLALGLAAIYPVFGLIPLLYVGTCVAWGLGLAMRARDPCLAASGLAAVVMHMSWASGFLSRVALGSPAEPSRSGTIMKGETAR